MLIGGEKVSIQLQRGQISAKFKNYIFQLSTINHELSTVLIWRKPMKSDLLLERIVTPEMIEQPHRAGVLST